MKKYNNTNLFRTFLFASITFLFACDKTPAETCSVYDTDKFVGNYNVSEFCQQGFGHGVSYGVVNPGTNADNEIIFTNFLNSGQNLLAYIDCNGEYFRIPQQNLGSTGLTAVGEGNYFNSGGYEQLQFSVQLNEYGQANYCTYTFSK